MDYKLAEIKHFLIIHAPANKVFRAITEEEGLAGWWTRQVSAKPEAESIAEFRFGDRYHNKMRIKKLVPDKRIEWECEKGDREWIGTRFIFDLEEKEGATTLRFTHGNWQKDTDFFASCNYHWGFYMKSLKSYCETGQGEPFNYIKSQGVKNA